jgi:plastocyanin
MLSLQRRAVLGTALAALCLAGLSGCEQPAHKPQTAQIVVDQMAFGPAPAELHVGDTLMWINRDMFEHSATAKDGQFDVDLPSGAAGSTVLTKAGMIQYACKFHPGMTGQIVVSE